MAVDETQAQEGKPVRSKRPVYDVLRRMTLYTAPELDTEVEAFVLLAEGVSAPSRGKAIDVALGEQGEPFAGPFGAFATVRHGELVVVDRPDPHAALLDALVVRMSEVMPDVDPEQLREQARLAVEQNGAS